MELDQQDPQAVIKKRCAHKPCRAEFETTEPAQKYCTPQHGKMARRSKAKSLRHYTKATIDRPTQLCPHPNKKVFVTLALANDAANALGGNIEGIHPYRCPCGALHIGHS